MPAILRFLSRTADGGDDFSHITSKEGWLQKYPGLSIPYSTCNPPGANIDRADCRGSYTVPTDLTPGVYTFMWWWEFNPGQFYRSCADMRVLAAPADGGDGADPGTDDPDGADQIQRILIPVTGTQATRRQAMIVKVYLLVSALVSFSLGDSSALLLQCTCGIARRTVQPLHHRGHPLYHRPLLHHRENGQLGSPYRQRIWRYLLLQC